MTADTDDRMAALRRAAEHWKRQLVDVSGNNRLLNYRDLRVGTLDLTPGPDCGVAQGVLESLLSGRAVQLRRLFPEEESQGDARRRLSLLYRQAQGNLDEKGVHTLFVVVGLATWTVDSGTVPNAPVVLLPVSLTPVDAARWDFRIDLSGEPHVNPVLAHVLQSEFGVDAGELDGDLELGLPATVPELVMFMDSLASRWPGVRGMSVTPRLVVGNFVYSTMPMVEDLEKNLEAFAENDLVAAIAGVEEARELLAAGVREPSLRQPDVDPPESEFLALDADASQHRAINRVLAGESMVIWGPPGTGKSQTIANLIAALAATGRRVLFVAEKRAAIEVVVERLRRVGLEGLVMDAHGGIGSKRDFARQMADSMRSIRSVPEEDHSGVHSRLLELRGELLGYDRAMHGVRDPWGVSLHGVLGELLGAPSEVSEVGAMSGQLARGLDRDGLDRLMRDVVEWVGLGGHRLVEEYPEWAGSRISTAREARDGLSMVRDISGGVLAGARDRALSVLGALGLSCPESVEGWFNLLEWLVEVEDYQKSCEPGVYLLDHDALGAALSPGRRWWGFAARVWSPRYRRALEQVRSVMRDPGFLSGQEACGVVERAQQQVFTWRDEGGVGEVPVVTGGIRESFERVQDLMESLWDLDVIFPSHELEVMPYGDLRGWLERVSSQGEVAARLERMLELRRGLSAAGFGDLLDRVGNGVPASRVAAALEHSWLRAVWDDAVFGDSLLSGFNGGNHSRRQQEYIDLDHRHLEVTPGRVRRAAAESAVAAMNAHAEEADLVNREAVKRSRHLPVRRLFQRAPNVLTAIRPCWAMSPLLVSELVPAGVGLFDVVIFDEASQIPPAEAMGVLARAPQAVIAGDDRQLPPTDFFTRYVPGEGYEEDEAGNLALVDDIESILDVAKASPIGEELLQWHYRSQDGRLIAFSNANIYQGALTSFPGVRVEGPVVHHLVPFRGLPERSTRSHPDEVVRVVEMVLEHAGTRPEVSLGVITFGIHHADNIDNVLRVRLRELADPGLDRFFADDASERFFVKNIERVQGDERDVIILSVGYHRAADGSLPYRFGPLNQEGGERRLNVAVTRQRQEMHLVSSFSHRDMDPGRSDARGVELLRQYLEFAASGGAELGSVLSDVPLNGFELDVMERLSWAGIPVTPQYGVGGYRLDFACGHPDQPGRMVLAVEADGASYHSGHTARERDRLRQEVLEAKGWRFHRVWSTSWFRDREAEVEKVVTAWRDACAAVDGGDPGDYVVVRRGSGSQGLNDRYVWDLDAGSWGRDGASGEMLRPVHADGQAPYRTAPKPLFGRGGSIGDYPHVALVALARWVMSDTLLRTDEELHRELRRELGFSRGGSRINPALQAAIDEAKGGC